MTTTVGTSTIKSPQKISSCHLHNITFFQRSALQSIATFKNNSKPSTTCPTFPDADEAYGSYCAPSVLIFFINMMLFKSDDLREGCKEFMFEGQGTLQMILVVVSVACIPVMLGGIPIYEICARRRRKPPVSFWQNCMTFSLSLKFSVTLKRANC